MLPPSSGPLTFLDLHHSFELQHTLDPNNFDPNIPRLPYLLHHLTWSLFYEHKELVQLKSIQWTNIADINQTPYLLYLTIP